MRLELRPVVKVVIEDMTLSDVEAGLNRPYFLDLLAECVLCEHLDTYHGGTLSSCRCCASSPSGHALPVRFFRRTILSVDMRTGVETHTRTLLRIVR